MKWISVKKRLPRLGLYVLIYREEYDDVNVDYCIKDWKGEVDWNGHCEEDVTHWMPLPKKPKRRRAR